MTVLLQQALPSAGLCCTAGVKCQATIAASVLGGSCCAGMKGGSVLNPINALAKLLAGMVDDNNHITVKGFYEYASLRCKLVAEYEQPMLAPAAPACCALVPCVNMHAPNSHSSVALLTWFLLGPQHATLSIARATTLQHCMCQMNQVNMLWALAVWNTLPTDCRTSHEVCAYIQAFELLVFHLVLLAAM